MYPEYYRKSSEHVKGSNDTTPDPFLIARILQITSKASGKMTLIGFFKVPFQQVFLNFDHKSTGISPLPYGDKKQ